VRYIFLRSFKHKPLADYVVTDDDKELSDQFHRDIIDPQYRNSQPKYQFLHSKRGKAPDGEGQSFTHNTGTIVRFLFEDPCAVCYIGKSDAEDPRNDVGNQGIKSKGMRKEPVQPDTQEKGHATEEQIQKRFFVFLINRVKGAQKAHGHDSVKDIRIFIAYFFHRYIVLLLPDTGDFFINLNFAPNAASKCASS